MGSFEGGVCSAGDGSRWRVEQVSGLDAVFLYCETPAMHLHVCGLLLLDPSNLPAGYSYERIRATALERLPQIAAVRRKLANVPFDLGRPFWIDDPDLDIDSHLHRVVLEAPADERALANVVGEIASSPLPRDRPLWEVWVIEGLADGRVAILVKMHHSTIDGVSGANIMGRLLDLEPTPPRRCESPHEWRAKTTPSPLELLSQSMISRLSEPLDLARLVPVTAWRLATTAWRFRRRETDAPSAAIPFTAPRTSFNTTITARRSVAFTDVSLSDIKMVKNSFGVTVNDVVTAVVGGALRHYLEDLGELPDRPLIAAEPISVHDRTTKREGATKLSVMFSTLATDEKDPVERVRIIAAANSRAKEINNMVGADTFVRWAEHFWLNAIGLGARVYSTLNLADHHPVIHNLILSNVPGPPNTLYFAGARLVGFYPLGPITDGAGLNVTVLSEGGRVGFGIVTCPQLIPRVWDLAESIREAVRELVEAAKTQQ
jgi:diacylglycerol O-acyltransferase